MSEKKFVREATKRHVANKDIKKISQSLTVRQRRFCYEYVADFNQSQAVLRAGYVTRYPSRQANNLMKNDGIIALIEELQGKKKTELTSVDPNFVISKITAIVSDPDAKHADQLRGLELLAKHLGMFIDRQELTGKDGGPLSVQREEIKQEAAEIVSLLNRLHARKDLEDKTNVVELKKSA